MANILSEEYVVKFWNTNEQGFKEQFEETVRFASKGKHAKAEAAIMSKYRKLGQKIDIVSVTYQ